jgi:hypothetical protein
MMVDWRGWQCACLWQIEADFCWFAQSFEHVD